MIAIYWLQRTKQGQQAIDKVLQSPRAKTRVRRVRFSAEQNVKILEASQRTKPNKVQRRRSKPVEVQKETFSDSSGVKTSTDKSISSTVVGTTLSTASTWNESSLKLLRSALKRDEASTESDNNESEDAAEYATQPSTSIDSVDECKFASERLPVEKSTQQDKEDPKSPMQHNLINHSSDCPVETALDFSGVLDDYSPIQSTNIARSARDSLLLTRMDPTISSAEPKPGNVVRPQLLSLPSLEECPSDEQEEWNDDDNDDNNNSTQEQSENVAENIAPSSRQVSTADTTPLSPKSLDDDKYAATAPGLTLSPTSRPFGLSNRPV